MGVEIAAGLKCVEPHNKYLVTLPDGLIGDNKIVQIKCPHKCFRLAALIIIISTSVVSNDTVSYKF